MNKRLRKKLYRGEFARYGFYLEFTTKEKLAWDLPGSKRLDGPGVVFSDNLDKWAHEHGWCIAPGGDGKRWGCVVMLDNRKPNAGLTDVDRDIILAYITCLPEVDKVVASRLVCVDGLKDAEDDRIWDEFCKMADETLGSR